MARRAWGVLAIVLATPAFGDDVADLSSPDVRVRLGGLYGLRRLGEAARPAADVTTAALHDSEAKVRLQAAARRPRSA